MYLNTKEEANMGKRLTALIVVALLFGALASGCTGGAQDSTSVDVSTDTGGEAEGETTEGTEKPTETQAVYLGCG
jgi:hypothetical protein